VRPDLRCWLGLGALVVWGCTGTQHDGDTTGAGGLTPGAGGTASGAGGMRSDRGGVGVDGGATASGGGGTTSGAGGIADASVDASGSFEIPGARPDLYDGPALLSQAGLYADLSTGTLAKGLREYEPRGVLWSDGASKRRWIKLPDGAVIDSKDMDDWVFPTDTRVFKEFTRDNVRIETRMIWKRGPNDWPMVAFIWNPQQTEAYAAPDGRKNASGTPHDVPDATQCPTCHSGRADRLLGPTALMLSHPGPGLTIDTLIAERRLSNPPVRPLTLPGDAETQNALAYLHANCGNCHNPKRAGADRDISVYFWQEASALATLEDTVTYKSLVTSKGSPLWIDAVLERMADRGGRQQMPPLATELVDVDGLAKVRTLMDRLRKNVQALPARARGGNCPGTDAVYRIFETAEASCSRSFCHGGSLGGLYYSTAQQLHDATVAVPADGDGCGKSGLSRVEPGHPERSVLWLKLNPGPPCGTIMPPTHALTPAQIDAVGSWISGCAATP
jgi:hypothetical protein